MALVEQELPTLPEHLGSTSVFSGVRVARSLVFCVVFWGSLFVLFILTIVLSVLRFMDSNYSFNIFKHNFNVNRPVWHNCQRETILPWFLTSVLVVLVMTNTTDDEQQTTNTKWWQELTWPLDSCSLRSLLYTFA